MNFKFGNCKSRLPNSQIFWLSAFKVAIKLWASQTILEMSFNQIYSYIPARVLFSMNHCSRAATTYYLGSCSIQAVILKFTGIVFDGSIIQAWEELEWGHLSLVNVATCTYLSVYILLYTSMAPALSVWVISYQWF